MYKIYKFQMKINSPSDGVNTTAYIKLVEL